MTAPTHIAFGLLTAAGAFALGGDSLHGDLPIGGYVVLGSLLPDIDTPNSAIGRAVPFVSGPIERRWGHRTVTHSLLALSALAVLALPLFFYRRACFGALLIGYGSHLAADCATKSGLPLFYPNPAVCVFPGSSRLRVRTGSLLGEGVVLLVLLILLLVSLPVLRVGGIWRTVRYLIGTPAAAYTDFRDATSETVLVFEGRWRRSRKAINGEAMVLDATPDWFLIAFGDRVLVYGEQGDVLPDRSRVRETGRAIRAEVLEVRGERFDQVLERVPKGAFLSGRLAADTVFEPGIKGHLYRGQHTSVQVFPKALVFSYASRSQVARLSPRRQAHPDSLARLRGEVGSLTAQVNAMQVRRPPVHYLKLREVQMALAARRRALDGVRDRTVRFTGGLFVRIPKGRK